MLQLTRLLRGATGCSCRRCQQYDRFNSRASCKARLPFAVHCEGDCMVSTHAPLTRRDVVQCPILPQSGRFNSRASCEARPDSMDLIGRADGFNSRASCEARLHGGLIISALEKFQLTRLLRGATAAFSVVDWSGRFNSRASCEARPENDFWQNMTRHVSTHASLARRDRCCRRDHAGEGVSTHAPLARRDGLLKGNARGYVNVSTHAPLARRDHS